MNDKYIVVNNLKAGVKLSESSKFYLNDILVIGIMIFFSLITSNYIYSKLQFQFVLFNAFVGIFFTTEVKSNPKMKRWKALYLIAISDTFTFFPLKNESQQKRTNRQLEELKNEKSTI